MTSRVTRTAMSGRQERQKRQMLEPVLENYSSHGPNSVLSERHHDLPSSNQATSHVIICNQPASNSKSPKRSSSTTLINPMNLLGKLRDRYVKLMNEVAMGGDFTCVASYGCQITPDYPGTLEISRASKEQREMEVWRQQAAEVLQRESSRESERREPIGAQWVVVVVVVVQIQSPVADSIGHNTDRTNFDLRAQILQVIKSHGLTVGSRSWF